MYIFDMILGYKTYFELFQRLAAAFTVSVLFKNQYCKTQSHFLIKPENPPTIFHLKPHYTTHNNKNPPLSSYTSLKKKTPIKIPSLATPLTLQPAPTVITQLYKKSPLRHFYSQFRYCILDSRTPTFRNSPLCLITRAVFTHPLLLSLIYVQFLQKRR